jgi:hypothetical protein
MIILTFLESKTMTLTINNHNVKKAVINLATQTARTKGVEVVIFGVMRNNVMNYLMATAKEFEGCDNKDELKIVTRVDRDGNFVD